MALPPGPAEEWGMDAEHFVRAAAAIVDMVTGWAGDKDAAVALPSRSRSSVAGRELCMPFHARWRPRLLVPAATMAGSASRPAAASLRPLPLLAPVAVPLLCSRPPPLRRRRGRSPPRSSLPPPSAEPGPPFLPPTSAGRSRSRHPRWGRVTLPCCAAAGETDPRRGHVALPLMRRRRGSSSPLVPRWSLPPCIPLCRRGRRRRGRCRRATVAVTRWSLCCRRAGAGDDTLDSLLPRVEGSHEEDDDMLPGFRPQRRRLEATNAKGRSRAGASRREARRRARAEGGTAAGASRERGIPGRGTATSSLVDGSVNDVDGNAEVPKQGVFLNASETLLEGNSRLCGGVAELHIPACSTPSSDSSRRRRSFRVKVIASVLITAISLLMILIILNFLYRRKKVKQQSLVLPSFGAKFPTITYKDLAEATGQFSPSNFIGRGRYGSVYKAMLHGPTDYVAVKVFDMETRGASRSFTAECEALRSLRHRNLVPILTACSSMDSGGNDFKALVYEFMAKGSLDSFLHPKGDGTQDPCFLPLAQRLSIALDIANALEYLHHSSQRPIVHSDLKPSNILLSNDMTARISDFGLARFFDNASTASTAALNGTIGYIAPEYAAGGRQVMASGDVYAFGIILLEKFTGRRPTDDMFKDGVSIVSFVETSLSDHMTEVVDPQLLEEIDDFEAQNESTVTAMECLRSVLKVCLSCTCQSPNERMSMREVVKKLQAIGESYFLKKQSGSPMM